MSAGTKLVALRDALSLLLPYAQHKRECYQLTERRPPCTCQLDRVLATIRALSDSARQEARRS